MKKIKFTCQKCGRETSAYEDTYRADEKLCRVCSLIQSENSRERHDIVMEEVISK